MLVLLLGVVCATVPTFVSWIVGLYLLRTDPMVLAGAVADARNSTTAMRAISDKAKSTVPAFGYPVPYAVSTVVFLIHGYLAMVLSRVITIGSLQKPPRSWVSRISGIVNFSAA